MRIVMFVAVLILFFCKNLVFAEDNSSHAQQAAQDADQILSELETAHRSADTMKVESLGEAYSKTLANVDQEVQNLKAQGRNSEASSLEETVHQSILQHQQVLQQVRGQVSEQARFGIDRGLQASIQSQGVPQDIKGLVGSNRGQENGEERSKTGTPSLASFKGNFSSRGSRPF